MTKRTAIILSAATLSFALALAPAAFAEDAMKKDTMSNDSMSKELDEEGQHVEGFDVQRRDVQRHDVQGFDVEGRHEKGRDEEELGSSPAGTRLRPGGARRTYSTPMPDLLLALFAGILTIAAPCTLPVLPILLGASIGRRAGARPVFIAAGFVASFAFVALALNALAAVLHFDPDVLRTAGLALLVIFGALMIWPAAFERLTARLAGAGAALRPNTGAHTNFGGFVLGTTLGLVWTPCAGPVLGAILTAIATSPDHAHSALRAAYVHHRRGCADAGGRLRRTSNLDAPASRRTLHRATATGFGRDCNRLRAERFPAIRRDRARLAWSILSRRSPRPVMQGARHDRIT